MSRGNRTLAKWLHLSAQRRTYSTRRGRLWKVGDEPAALTSCTKCTGVSSKRLQLHLDHDQQATHVGPNIDMPYIIAINYLHTAALQHIATLQHTSRY